MTSVDCRFCNEAVPFTQHEMAYHIFDLADAETNWRLCRDCAEIRSEGDELWGGLDERGTCIDCDEQAAYGITLMKETPAGDVVPDDTVYHVLCEDHFEERTV